MVLSNVIGGFVNFIGAETGTGIRTGTEIDIGRETGTGADRWSQRRSEDMKCEVNSSNYGTADPEYPATKTLLGPRTLRSGTNLKSCSLFPKRAYGAPLSTVVILLNVKAIDMKQYANGIIKLTPTLLKKET